MIWVDNMAIPKGAPHPTEAHQFLDFLLREEVGAAISNAICYASPNQAAYPMIDPRILANPAVYPPPEVEARCEFVRDLGDVTRMYDAAWQAVKTA
jgi:spermidine/putrescine-binding protein